jgi:integrase
LKQVTRQTLDKQLFWPLQQQLKPSTIKQIFQILKRVFKSACGVGLIRDNPMIAISFNELVTTKITAKAGRLTVIDLPKVFNQSKQSSSSVKTLTLLMLLFGTRVGETSQAKWSDFDRRNNLWRLPVSNTKTKQAHRLPMTQLVWQLLAEHKQDLPKKLQRSPWLFPKANDHKGVISDQYASQQVSQLAKGQWSAHDLRKLARTAWLELGIDFMIGEFLLNHKLNQVNQAYIQTFADVKCQEAINIWHQYLIHNGLPYNEFNLSAGDLR